MKVPFALQPKAREERIEVLEKGVQLEDDGRLTVGAVPTSRCEMMLVDFDVVRETHVPIIGSPDRPCAQTFARQLAGDTHKLG